MRTRIICGSLIVLALASLMFAILQFGKARHAAAARARLEQEQKERAAFLERLAAEHWLPAEEIPAVVPTSHARQNPIADPAAGSEARETLRIAASIAGIRWRWGPFFQSRGTPEDQASAISARIAAHHQAMSDLARAAPLEVRNGPAHQAEIDAEIARFRTDLENLIGAGGYRAYERYQAETPYWNEVRSVASRLYESDTPLTADQARRLGDVLILHATSDDGRISGTIKDWEAVLNQAAWILTPLQLDVLQALRDQRLANQAMGRLARGQP